MRMPRDGWRMRWLLAPIILLLSGCGRNPEQFYPGSVVIDGKQTLPDAAYWRTGSWRYVIAEDVIPALGGSFERTATRRSILLVLNGKRVIISPGWKELEGDLYIQFPVDASDGRLEIDAAPFQQAVEFAFPHASVKEEKGAVYVQTGR